jgi:hypothetical protein
MTERNAARAKFSLEVRNPEAFASMQRRLNELAAAYERERQRGRLQGAKGTSTNTEDDE